MTRFYKKQKNLKSLQALIIGFKDAENENINEKNHDKGGGWLNFINYCFILIYLIYF